MLVPQVTIHFNDGPETGVYNASYLSAEVKLSLRETALLVTDVDGKWAEGIPMIRVQAWEVNEVEEY